jgi:hypothetical protein
MPLIPDLSISFSTFPVTPPPPVTKYSGYRVLHKVEGGWQNTPLGMPEVMPPIDAISVNMTEAIQLMSYNLMVKGNSLITGALWTRVHDWDRAFTNFNGFDRDGDPRANYVLKRDLSSPLPKYDKCQRVCGGSFIRGVTAYSFMQAVKTFASMTVELVRNIEETTAIIKTMGAKGFLINAKEFLTSDNVLRCVAGIHGIDADKPMPDTQTILDNNWYIYAVSMDTPTNISHFPQGQGGPVLIPFIIRGAIEFPLQHFERWERDYLPDPLKVYNV